MFSKWHCISYTSIVNASEYVMYTCSPCFDHGKRFLFQSHCDAMLIYVLSLVIEDSSSIVSFSVVEPPNEFIWTMVNYQMDDKALFNYLWKFIIHSTNFGCVFIFIRAKSSNWWSITGEIQRSTKTSGPDHVTMEEARAVIVKMEEFAHEKILMCYVS